jgi:dTDP-glucose 4,6-dehydratase
MIFDAAARNNQRTGMARLLVTGGAGFIGANFVHYWLAEHPGDRLVVLDALTYAGNPANLNAAQARAEYRFIHGDICDTTLVEQLLREETLDTIVHLAAETNVARLIEGPDAFEQSNVVGTHSMLKAARRVWLEERTVPFHRFHQVSTDQVYGSLGPKDPPVSESTTQTPTSPYSASKAAADHLVSAYHHSYGLQATVSICCNNYGPYQSPEKLIPLMIAQLLAGKSLPVYGDGHNIRDWLHVQDHCRGIEAVLTRGKPGEVYNIGGRSECENIHLVHKLCAIIDDYIGATVELRQTFPNCAVAQGEISERLVRYVKDRPGHDRRYAIDSTKIERDCDFRPQISLEAGLRATVDWYLQRADTLRSGWQRTLV